MATLSMSTNRSSNTATLRPSAANVFSSNTSSSSASSRKTATLKFGTVGADKAAKLKRPSVLGTSLFDTPSASAVSTVGHPAAGESEKDKAVAGHHPLARSGTQLALGHKPSDEGVDTDWHVTLAERKVGGKVKGKAKKDLQPLFTLYVTTPTSNLTLARSVNQLAELDAKLRLDIPDHLPPVKPAILDGPWNAIAATPSRGRNVLQTLSRTLAPGRRTNLNRLSFLPSPPTSPARSPVTPQTQGRARGHAHAPSVDALMSAPDALAAAASAAADPTTVTKLGNYLTECAKETEVKHHPDWQEFFRVGSEDLESTRLERRIKRVRSDVASHLSPEGGDGQSLHEDGADVGKSDKGAGVGAAGRDDQDQDQEEIKPIGDDPISIQAASAVGLATPASLDTQESLDPDKLSQSGLSAAEQTSSLSSPSRAIQAKKRRTPSRSVKKETVEKKVTTDDFEIMRVLGKGCAGKVLLVRYKQSKNLYAMKAIHKHHVLAHRELQHTLTEQSVLKIVAKEQSNPFVVRLWWSFHDPERLFLVMDFHPGGDLATQLARWGRLGRDRARFYAAEIVEGVEGLHNAGVIYRDLKPENILIAADGHCILTDFGLSKQFIRQTGAESPDDPSASPSPSWMKVGKSLGPPSSSSSPGWWADQRETTSTFCGTAEYLAPEVLLGEPYSFEVDWWSFGTMLYEMLTGLTPFWNEDHSIMYRRVLHEELSFSDDARVLDQDTKSLLRGLLQKNPVLRMTHKRIKRHPYFSMIDWTHVYYKRYIPPYVPTLDPLDESDTQNFDDTFLNMAPQLAEPDEEKAEGGSNERPPSGEPQKAVDEHGRDVFDGYSYRGNAPTGSIEDEEAEELTDEDDADEDGASRSSYDGSTRPTSIERDLSSGGGKDLHGRDASSGLDSLVESLRGTGAGESRLTPTSDVEEEDEPEDDWDLVEAPDMSKVERNGRRAQGATLMGRGVVDKYRLRIARIGKKTSSTRQHASELSRSDSRQSSRSSIAGGESAAEGSPESPKPTRPISNRLASGERLKFRAKRSRNELKNASSNSALSPGREDMGRSITPASAQSEQTLGDPSRRSPSRKTNATPSKASSDEIEDLSASTVAARKSKRLTLNKPLNLFSR